MSKVIGSDEKKEQLIKNQWRDFSKTVAFAELVQYMEANKDMLLADATDMTISINGTRIAIDGEKSNLLLQRRAGIDIVKTYIGLFVE